MRKIFLLLLVSVLFSCKEEKEISFSDLAASGDTLKVEFAKGFSLVNYGDFKILKVTNTTGETSAHYTYLLAEEGAEIPKGLSFDEKITIPVKRVVVTSTTHIPALESLEAEHTLVGFPHPDYISSIKTRERIADNKIKDLGENENLNTETILDLNPDVMIGFTVNSNDKTYSNISRSGIPVVYNSDWQEESPLGKAEWIKFFGAFFNKEDLALKEFNQVKQDYNEAKALVRSVQNRPKVLSGAMFKDVWHVPKGESWAAQFIKDAGGDYLYAETEGTGGLALSFESVLDKAKDADIWLSPAGFNSYEDMLKSSQHYGEFKAFKDKKVYGITETVGETGGVVFFELAPNRPDLVLQDLIYLFHPDLMPDHYTVFYKPLR